MKIVRLEHVEVVVLLKTDGDGVVIVLDQSMSQELEVLMDAKFAHMFELKDAIDLVGEVLACLELLEVDGWQCQDAVKKICPKFG